MLKNSIRLALRSFLSQPGTTTVNLAGMVLGITSFLLIFLFVRDELSFDRFHEKADRTYRMVEIMGDVEESASQPFLSGPTLLEEFPQYVEHQTRFFNLNAPFVPVRVVRADGDERLFNERSFFYTDSTVFDVFDFDVVRGDPSTALDNPYTAAITEETGVRWFGSRDPLGQTFLLQSGDAVEVTAIMANVPTNSHVRPDVLVSFRTIEEIYARDAPHMIGIMNGFAWNPVWTYVVLRDGVAPETVDALFPEFVEKHFHPAIKSIVSLYLQPLTRIHLHSELDYEIGPPGKFIYVVTFAIVALLILLVACVNFINMATARSMGRSREVGVRKASGATRSQLIRQFLAETYVQVVVACLVSVPATYFLIPVLNGLSGKELEPAALLHPAVMVVLLAMAALLGVGAGLIPAYGLSRIHPTWALKGRLSSMGGAPKSTLRKSLITFQMVVSVVLILGTAAVVTQVRYVQSARLGFDEESVVVVNLPASGVSQTYPGLREALVADPLFSSVTASQHVVGNGYDTCAFVTQDAAAESYNLKCARTHDDFATTMNMELLAGRDFSSEHATDPGGAILVNEAFVRSRGWASALDAIGQSVVIPTSGGTADVTVVGVVKDFHYASLHEGIDPFVIFRFSEGSFGSLARFLTVKMNRADVADGLEALQAHWAARFPAVPMDHFFLEDALDNAYESEDQLARVGAAFAILAIVIACLGLFAMAAFMTGRRTREIGIRKALGSSVSNVFVLVTREFVGIAVVATIISVPIGIFLIRSWNASFAFSAGIQASHFALTALFVMMVTLLATSYHSIRAARTNPAKALRSD